MLFPKIFGTKNPRTAELKKSCKRKDSDALVRVSNSPIEFQEENSNRVPFCVGALYDIIPGRLALTVHSSQEFTKSEIKRLEKRVYFFSCDLHERFEPFCLDFGPVKLSVVHRFCKFVHEKVNHPRLAKRQLAYYCENDSASCSNTAFLLGCYSIIHWGYSPEQACCAFNRISSSPIIGFRDATARPADYTISLLDCFRGLQGAITQGWFDFHRFDVDEYEHWDDVTNGDLHEVTPKFIAFRGPQSSRQNPFPCTAPEELVAVFKDKGVSAVVRLNEPSSYDARAFTDHGIRHYDLGFSDCGVPPAHVIRRFLDICDRDKGRIAVHCKAGLGRTGTMIALWMMRALHWRANDAIAWLRIARPGSVIGAQQHFLQSFENVRWSGNTPVLPLPPCAVSAPDSDADARGLASAMTGRHLNRGAGSQRTGNLKPTVTGSATRAKEPSQAGNHDPGRCSRGSPKMPVAQAQLEGTGRRHQGDASSQVAGRVPRYKPAAAMHTVACS